MSKLQSNKSKLELNYIGLRRLFEKEGNQKALCDLVFRYIREKYTSSNTREKILNEPIDPFFIGIQIAPKELEEGLQGCLSDEQRQRVAVILLCNNVEPQNELRKCISIKYFSDYDLLYRKGIITAEEAERLLLALNGTPKAAEREGVSDVVNQAINKAGGAINTLAKALGKQAEKLEPKVKDVAEKVSGKASVIADDAKTYAEKLREKRAKAKEEKQQDIEDIEDIDDIDVDEEEEIEVVRLEEEKEEQPQQNKKGDVTKLFTNLTDTAGQIQYHVKEKASETKEFIGKVKELREDMKKEKEEQPPEEMKQAEEIEKEETEQTEQNDVLPSDYLKKADKGIENVQSQLQQLDDMEAFLKNAFGEYENWEDEEETQEGEKKEE